MTTTPRERPILFSAPMVRAILDGRKTQTRQFFWQAAGPSLDIDVDEQLGVAMLSWLHGPGPGHEVQERTARHACPYGKPGDRLWVCETHAQFAVGNRTGLSPQCVAYRATCGDDGSFDYVNNGDEVMRLKVTKWTPSIFMPRWASRITLEITEVRVQRLQSISEDDARAEGVEPGDAGDADLGGTARGAFCRLWDSINGKRSSWASGPWVWALTFRRLP